MDITRTHYIISTTPGAMHKHVWLIDKRISAGRSVIDRSCVTCPRHERWLQLARKRSSRKYF